MKNLPLMAVEKVRERHGQWRTFGTALDAECTWGIFLKLKIWFLQYGAANFVLNDIEQMSVCLRQWKIILSKQNLRRQYLFISKLACFTAHYFCFFITKTSQLALKTFSAICLTIYRYANWNFWNFGKLFVTTSLTFYRSQNLSNWFFFICKNVKLKNFIFLIGKSCLFEMSFLVKGI